MHISINSFGAFFIQGHKRTEKVVKHGLIIIVSAHAKDTLHNTYTASRSAKGLMDDEKKTPLQLVWAKFAKLSFVSTGLT